jgi:hypothetical protein
MGIYYSADGSSFTSTLDIQPKTFFNNDLNLEMSVSDFIRVCNVLNVKKKDTIAAIIIQKWWRNIQSKKHTNTKNKEIFSIWNLLWVL